MVIVKDNLNTTSLDFPGFSIILQCVCIILGSLLSRHSALLYKFQILFWKINRIIFLFYTLFATLTSFLLSSLPPSFPSLLLSPYYCPSFTPHLSPSLSLSSSPLLSFFHPPVFFPFLFKAALLPGPGFCCPS